MKLLVFLCVLGVSQTWGWNLFGGEPRIDPHEEVSEDCRNLAAWGNCDFYTCLERRFPCGHDGFAIKIGKHFCEKGMTLKGRLTPEGQRFFNRSIVCMTTSLLPVYESYSTRCGDVKDEAVSGMLSCSRQEVDGMDFCSFVRSNADAYNDMYGLEEISRLIGLRRPSLLARMLMDATGCGANALQEKLNTLPAAFNDFMGRVSDSLSRFRNRLTDWWSNL